MMSDTSNDNHSAGENTGTDTGGPDAHGQAALLLVESLIHALMARGIITSLEAVEVIDVATEVKTEVAAQWGDSPATLQKSLGLLRKMASSLRTEHGHA